MEKRKGAKTYSAGFTITLTNKKQLDELLATGGYMSASDVIRAALRALHKQSFPHYKLEKERIMGEKQRLTALTAEEYCTQELGGIVDGDICVISHPTNPSLTAKVALKGVKTLPKGFVPSF